MHTKDVTNDQLAELIRSQIQAMRAEMSTRFEKIDARLEKIGKKLEEHDGYFAALSEKVVQIDERLQKMEDKSPYVPGRLD